MKNVKLTRAERRQASELAARRELRLFCIKHGLDFGLEWQAYKKWQKEQRMICYFCAAACVVCLFLI